MCGIFAFYLNRELNDSDIELGRKGIRMLEHRGPDGINEWMDISKGIFLSHSRLEIVGLGNQNKQPMLVDDNAIVFNGEIYNYLELREELIKKNINFNTKGDTEVLLKYWLHNKKRCLEKLDGMYAFCVVENKKMHVVSDLFGEKPLYYAKTSDGIYISSEPGNLIELLNLEFSPGSEDINAFMSLGFILPPNTGFKNLYSMPPSTILEVEQGKINSIVKYWSQTNTDKNDLKTKYTKQDEEDLLEILINSTRRRIRADVSLGIFLSSGVDSTLIAAIIKKELGADIKSYTVSFGSDADDESSCVSKTAKYLGIEHSVVTSNQCESNKVLGQMKDMYGVLNDNYTSLAVQEMCRLAKPHIKVGLTGIGCDEMFYGYHKYKYAYSNRIKYKVLPFLINRPGIGDLLKLNAKLQKVYDVYGGNKFRNFLSLKNAHLISLLEDLDGFKVWVEGNEINGEKLFEAIRNFDLSQTICGSYAPAFDRPSMRTGMELRTPYLNKEVYEFTQKFEQEVFFNKENKYMLRGLLDRYVPRKYITQKKGFIMPIDNIVTKASSDLCRYVINKSFLKNMNGCINNKLANSILFRAAVLKSYY